MGYDPYRWWTSDRKRGLFGFRLAQELRDLRGGQRPREEIALKALRTEFAQERELHLGLDAFRDGFNLECLGEGEDRGDDGIGSLRFGDLLEEEAVDLDDVDGQTMEVTERGVTGAEVINGDAHSELFEAVHLAHGLFEVGEQKRLGEFQFEKMGRHG